MTTTRKRNNSRRRRSGGMSAKHIVIIVACVLVIVFAIQIPTRGSKAADTSTGATERVEESVAENNESTTLTEIPQVTLPDGTPSQMVTYPGFVVSFNSTHHEPNYVIWELTDEKARGTLPRNTTFTNDPTVVGCAVDQDYKRSGYDRGHMAPAADMKWSQEAMDACFMLTNICPQLNSLNNGTWKKLEEKTRTWAMRDQKIIIIAGPVLSDRLTKTIGETGVTVPNRFFKILYTPNTQPPRAIGFIMNNGYNEGGLQETAVTIDQIEDITGIDFFSNYSATDQDTLESQCDFARWSRSR
jgi:endonuclease G